MKKYMTPELSVHMFADFTETGDGPVTGSSVQQNEYIAEVAAAANHTRININNMQKLLEFTF